MNDSKPSSNFQQEANSSQKPQEAMEKKENKTMSDKCWNRHISDPLWNVPGSSEPRPLAWKTKMCPHWKRERRCNSGGICKFAHGSAELRSLYGEIPLASSSPKTSMREDMLANNHEEEEHSMKKPSRIETLSRKLVGIYGDWIDES